MNMHPLSFVVKSFQRGCAKLAWDLWCYSKVKSTKKNWLPRYIEWSEIFISDNFGGGGHSNSNKSTHSSLHQFHCHGHWYSHKVGESSTIHNYKRRLFHEECYALKCMREREIISYMSRQAISLGIYCIESTQKWAPLWTQAFTNPCLFPLLFLCFDRQREWSHWWHMGDWCVTLFWHVEVVGHSKPRMWDSG